MILDKNETPPTHSRVDSEIDKNTTRQILGGPDGPDSLIISLFTRQGLPSKKMRVSDSLGMGCRLTANNIIGGATA